MSARPAGLPAAQTMRGRHARGRHAERRGAPAAVLAARHASASVSVVAGAVGAGAGKVAATAGSTVLALGLLAGLAEPAVAATPPGTGEEFAALRQCESGGNYRINTGNGYYGAYQFDLSTWRSVGGSGRPDQAAPAVQDEMARRLQAQRGWAPWPACSRKLGLGTSRWAHPAPPAPAAPAPAPAPAPAATDLSALPLSPQVPESALAGRLSPVLGTGDRVAVVQVQTRLRRLGYGLRVDGLLGPRTLQAIRAFQASRGLAADGIVGRLTAHALQTAR